MSEDLQNQQETMLRGTAWMTASNFISRLLGALYIIPWYIWMGQYGPEANGLFTMGYNIYALFLLISTAGIPVAIAKQVAKYNARGEEDHSFSLVLGILKFMLVLGLIFSAIMYLCSPLFSQMSGVGKPLIPVMRSLSLAVLIFPSMSVIRGYFQGLNNLRPFALSQIVEQLIRVIWMLMTTFFIMQIGSKNYVQAVTQSTFAAFIGMVASYVVLFYFLHKEGLLSSLMNRKESQEINSGALLFETLKEAIPFIITGSAIQLFQIIDQMTFINVMNWFGTYDKQDLVIQFSYFSANPNKITMILIAVASSIGGVGISLLTENFVLKDFRAASKLILDNLAMLLAFLLPATLGAVVLAKPIYTIFYGRSDQLAISLFVVAMLQVVILGLYTVLSPMIQALFENRKAIRYFLYGVGVKLLLQIPFIWLFRSYGPLLATTIALLVPIYFMYREIQHITGFNHKIVVKRSLLISILTGIMLILVILVEVLLSLILKADGRVSSVIHVILVGGVGIAVYGYMGLKIRMFDRFIGQQASRLRERLHIS